MREKEIRTRELNLLFCKMILKEEGKVMMELKHGKRTEQIPIEELVAEINTFTQGCATKLHIVTE